MDDPHGPMKAMMMLVLTVFNPGDVKSGANPIIGTPPTASFTTSPSDVCASCLERGIRLPETRTKTRAIEKSILAGVEVIFQQAAVDSLDLFKPQTSDIYAGGGPNNVHKWD
jgi:hypothetical protein